MKIVLDTNVIVGAFATRGLSHLILRRCLEKHEVILSPYILRELENALIRKLKVPPEKAHLNIDFLKNSCSLSEGSPIEPSACRDPEDLNVLGLALQTKADIIVSGDEDLLIIGTFQGIPILSPRQFWESERKRDPSLLELKQQWTSKKIHDKGPRKYQTTRHRRVEKSKR